MRQPRIRQQCPMCPEMLEFDVTWTGTDKPNSDNTTTFTLNAVTTPESTAHVWTHKPEGES